MLSVLATGACHEQDYGPPLPDTENVSAGARASDVIVVPPGAAARASDPRAPSPFPDHVTLPVDAILRIDNKDHLPATIGPFSVPARSRRAFRMVSTGRYAGGCTVHPSGRFTLVVTPRPSG
jgi:hypothetical protein